MWLGKKKEGEGEDVEDYRKKETNKRTGCRREKAEVEEKQKQEQK